MRALAADRLLMAGEQELDPKVEEDQHFDVDDEGDEGVRQAPVHGECHFVLKEREVFSVLCVLWVAFFCFNHYWTGAKLMRSRLVTFPAC